MTLREDIDKLIARHNVMHLEDDSYMLNNDQLADQIIEAVLQRFPERKEREIESLDIRKMVAEHDRGYNHALDDMSQAIRGEE